MDSPTTPETARDDRVPSALRHFTLFGVGLLLAFSIPLVELGRLAWNENLFSHAFLIPFIVGYLVWLEHEKLDFKVVRPTWSGWPPLFLGLGFAVVGVIELARGSKRPAQDYLALMMTAFYLLLLGGGLLFLGRRNMRVLAFPAAMLVFIVPFPVALVQAIEWFFQHASADAAHLLFSLVGQTLFRDGLVFHLPGMSVQVAQECSGIRSSLVLFITGLLAGQLFLRSGWRRAALALTVIPLGILRNGFRVFTLAMLASHVDPDVIWSPLHKQGGPLFFLLSLIPFFLFLQWLRKSERRQAEREAAAALTSAPTGSRDPGGLSA
jgi:exosortase C (VPDSG-CTERM-specific)